MGEVRIHCNVLTTILIISLTGLQCHTVPFSWKLVFESDHQLYELMMSACSSKEELEWRARLYRPPVQVQDTKDAGVHNSLYLNVKSLGTIFGKPGW
jgi:hypothetical protein